MGASTSGPSHRAHTPRWDTPGPARHRPTVDLRLNSGSHRAQWRRPAYALTCGVLFELVPSSCRFGQLGWGEQGGIDVGSRRLVPARGGMVVAWLALALVVLPSREAVASTRYREFIVPTARSSPTGITAGPDGALWFTEEGANAIGRITTAGTITEF